MDLAAIKIEFDRRLFAAHGADRIAQFLKIQPNAFPMAVAYAEARKCGMDDFEVVRRGLKVRPNENDYRVWALVLSIASDFLPRSLERHDYEWFQRAFTIGQFHDSSDLGWEIDRVRRLKAEADFREFIGVSR